MKAKKLLGYVIVSLPFMAFTALFILDIGLYAVLMIWGIIVIVVSLIIYGISLIMGD